MNSVIQQGRIGSRPSVLPHCGPRERLLTEGAAALSEAKLVVVSLRTGTHSLSTPEQKRDVSPAKALHLKATLEIARRFLTTTVERGKSLTRPGLLRSSCALGFVAKAMKYSPPCSWTTGTASLALKNYSQAPSMQQACIRTRW